MNERYRFFLFFSSGETSPEFALKEGRGKEGGREGGERMEYLPTFLMNLLVMFSEGMMECSMSSRKLAKV